MSDLFNLEIEQALLGALLVDNNQLDQIDLEPDDFFEPVHSELFAAICNEINAGRKVDPNILKPQFEGHPDLEDVGGWTYIIRLAGAVPVTYNAPHYARGVKDLSTRRRVVAAAEKIIGAAGNVSEDINELHDFVDNSLQQIDGGDTEIVTDAARLSDSYIEHLLSDRRGGGIRSGLAEYDRITGGFHDTDLTILAGRPAMGKTLLGVDMFLTQILSQDRVPVFVTCEMSSGQLLGRMASSLLDRNGYEVPYQWARLGEWEQRDRDKFVGAVKDLRGRDFHIVDVPSCSMAQLQRNVKRLKRRIEHSGKRMGCVFVDYLQLLRDLSQKNRLDEVSSISRQLKEVARRFEVPVIAISQLSRALEQREDKRPRLSDLRESGTIEQDADNVVTVYRHEYYIKMCEPAMAGTTEHDRWAIEMDECAGKIDVGVIKQRAGATGNCSLNVKLATNRVF